MITSEYILELSNVFHSGQVEAGSCIQKMIGTVRTGVILKDVSMEVHGGELSAVLGSKGQFMFSYVSFVAVIEAITVYGSAYTLAKETKMIHSMIHHAVVVTPHTMSPSEIIFLNL